MQCGSTVVLDRSSVGSAPRCISVEASGYINAVQAYVPTKDTVVKSESIRSRRGVVGGVSTCGWRIHTCG